MSRIPSLEPVDVAPTWAIKPFAQLEPHELYALLRLRSAVFVVEQNCVFLDMDNLDQQAHHCLGWHQGQVAACTRLFAPGVVYAQASIGRVAVAGEVRRLGLGKKLMEVSIQACAQLFGPQPIQIGAQLYLQRFYEGFGFRPVGEVYLEDDIEHIHMLRD
jgi:ElaA protein